MRAAGHTGGQIHIVFHVKHILFLNLAIFVTIVKKAQMLGFILATYQTKALTSR